MITNGDVFWWNRIFKVLISPVEPHFRTAICLGHNMAPLPFNYHSRSQYIKSMSELRACKNRVRRSSDLPQVKITTT